MSAYTAGLVAQVGINAVLAYSVYVTLATGQLSLGNAGFMAIGAYGVAYLTVDRHVALLWAFLAAALATGVIGVVVVGLPALRLRGIFLAMATLGFGEIVATFFTNLNATGGAQGFPGIPGMPFATIAAAALAVLCLIAWLERTRLWLVFRAVRDDEDAARFTGVPTMWIKVAAFGIGAAVAAVGGGLYAEFNYFIEPASFGFMVSALMVLSVVLGGTDNLLGPLLGALIFTLLPEYLRFLAVWRYAVYGSVLAVVLILRPRGLLPPFVLRRRVRRLSDV